MTKHFTLTPQQAERVEAGSNVPPATRVKPLRDLFQFDALVTGKPEAGIDYNSSGTTDEDGDCINCERKQEPRATGDNTVRLQVPVRVTPSDAVRVLRKIADWIESRPELLQREEALRDDQGGL